MKKMPTLYPREFSKDHTVKVVDTKPVAGLEFIAEGLGTPTEKMDGTCTCVKNNIFYKRYDAKHGKPIPPDATPCQPEADAVTGHMPCWRPCRRDNPEDKHLWEAYDEYCRLNGEPSDGTYEAVGPSWQANPYNLDKNILMRHGERVITDLPNHEFETIKEYLNTHNIEGIVFWYENEPVCKIKRSDFGFVWNNRTTKR